MLSQICIVFCFSLFEVDDFDNCGLVRAGLIRDIFKTSVILIHARDVDRAPSRSIQGKGSVDGTTRHWLARSQMYRRGATIADRAHGNLLDYVISADWLSIAYSDVEDVIINGDASKC